MDDIDIEYLGDPSLRNPVLVEGLPGVGHVGKLAAEYLIEEYESEPVCRLYASEFPPQVNVDDEGVASLTCAEFHAVDLSEPTPTNLDDEADDADGEESEATEDGEESEAPEDGDGSDAEQADDRDGFEAVDRDLLVLTGDHQAQSNDGHYHLTDAFLDVAEEFDVEEAYALGGVPTGELIEEYTVLGAVTGADRKEPLLDAGVEFRADEPAGGIVGVSGLLLGLGSRRGFDVACLMGETSGYLVDPKSARAVLEVLEDLLGFGVDYAALEARAQEMEEVIGKIQEMQEGPSGMPGDEELRYIG